MKVETLLLWGLFGLAVIAMAAAALAFLIVGLRLVLGW